MAFGVVALAVPLVMGVLAAPRLRAQAPTGQSAADSADRPAFDVVSVKVNRSGSGLALIAPQAGGLFTATNVTLNNLIITAFHLMPHQLYGLPEWGASEHFDIEARAEGNPTRDQINLMLQPLLEDRFKLAVHHETRQLPVFALVLSKPGKTGPGLLPHSDDTKCPDPAGPPLPPRSDMPAPCGGLISMNLFPTARISGNKFTMAMLAVRLSGVVDRIVVDRALSGVFDMNFTFAPLPPPGAQVPPGAGASDPSGPPSIFTALQEQLGLKLEPQTGPVDMLVIDHVEEPSPN